MCVVYWRYIIHYIIWYTEHDCLSLSKKKYTAILSHLLKHTNTHILLCHKYTMSTAEAHNWIRPVLILCMFMLFLSSLHSLVMGLPQHGCVSVDSETNVQWRSDKCSCRSSVQTKCSCRSSVQTKCSCRSSVQSVHAVQVYKVFMPFKCTNKVFMPFKCTNKVFMPFKCTHPNETTDIKTTSCNS